MPTSNGRKPLIILGLLFIIIISIGVIRSPKKEPVDEIEVSPSLIELDRLGESIENLEFNDLGGLSGDGVEGLMEEIPDFRTHRVRPR